MASHTTSATASWRAALHGTNIGLASATTASLDAAPKPWIAWKDAEKSRAPTIAHHDRRRGAHSLCFAVDTAHGVRGGIARRRSSSAGRCVALRSGQPQHGRLPGEDRGATAAEGRSRSTAAAATASISGSPIRRILR